jgi:hypothetical protein
MAMDEAGSLEIGEGLPEVLLVGGDHHRGGTAVQDASGERTGTGVIEPATLPDHHQATVLLEPRQRGRGLLGGRGGEGTAQQGEQQVRTLFAATASADHVEDPGRPREGIGLLEDLVQAPECGQDQDSGAPLLDESVQFPRGDVPERDVRSGIGLEGHDSSSALSSVRECTSSLW